MEKLSCSLGYNVMQDGPQGILKVEQPGADLKERHMFAGAGERFVDLHFRENNDLIPLTPTKQ